MQNTKKLLFTKSHSLGNDFIILDQNKNDQNNIESHPNWSDTVKKLCNRHTGIGADGILIIPKKEIAADSSNVKIFNADGSNGNICLNGARCVADYLHKTNKTPKKSPSKIFIVMGNKSIEHQILPSDEGNNLLITQKIDIGTVQKTESYEKKFLGHVVDVGNPHFIILQEKTLSWLRKHGKKIESYKKFPNKTNVEFIWPKKETVSPSMFEYNMIVYERGCGITQACSSGVAAVMTLLYSQKAKVSPPTKALPPMKVPPPIKNTTFHVGQNKKIKIQMPGGEIISWITSDEKVALQTKATIVFHGEGVAI